MAEDMKPEQLPQTPRRFSRRAALIGGGATVLAAASGIDRLTNPPSVLAAAGEYFRQLNGTDTQLLDKELKEAAGEAKVIGFFTTRTNGQGGQGTKGFWVEDDSQAPMYTAWIKYGGEQGLGLPITQRERDPFTGRIEQAFQKARIQLTVDTNGKVVKEEFANTFDAVEKKGINLNRSPYFIPDSWKNWDSDAGRTFTLTPEGKPTPGSIWDNHIQTVLRNPTQSKNPIPKQAAQAIENTYLKDPNFTIKYGTVVSIESYEGGALVVARTQRAALQYWRDPTPWTNNQPGQVVIANGCDIAKEVGLYSPDITTPKELPTGGGNGSVNGTEQSGLSYPKEVGILKRDGIVFHNLGSEIGVIITDQPYFQEKIVPLIKKYRPNGVEFFFYGKGTTLSMPTSPSEKYKTHRISGYFPSGYQNSFLSDTPLIFAERASDGVLEIHYGLFVTNQNPTQETIRRISYGVEREGIIRYIWGNDNLRQPDIRDSDIELTNRVVAGGYPVFKLQFNNTVTPIGTSR